QNGLGQPTFAVIGNLSLFYLVRADHRRVNQLANEMLEIAAAGKSQALAIEGHFVLANSLFYLGRFAESLEHSRLGSVARPDLSPLNIFVADIPAYALAYQASCLWQLGFPDQAAKKRRRALVRADSLNHPYSAATVRFQVVEDLLRVDPDL